MSSRPPSGASEVHSCGLQGSQGGSLDSRHSSLSSEGTTSSVDNEDVKAAEPDSLIRVVYQSELLSREDVSTAVRRETNRKLY